MIRDKGFIIAEGERGVYRKIMVLKYPKLLLLLIFMHVNAPGFVSVACGQSTTLDALFPVQMDAGGSKTIYLSDFEEIDWQVRKNTNLGPVDVDLRNDVSPLTVRNYLNYVIGGAYEQSMVHRSVPGFVVQGGGYTLTGTGEDFQVDIIINLGTVPGEFQLPNVRGTLAMALVDRDPDSGTSQWFINVGDNPGLDAPENGPFTVFGEVLPPGMEVVDAINALTRVNFGGAFGEVPMLRFEGEPVLFEDFVRIPTVTLLNPPELLSVQPEGLVDVTLDGHRLIIEALPDAAGEAALTLRFRHDGGWIEETHAVQVGTVVQTAFGPLSPVNGNQYFSPVFGQLEFPEEDTGSSLAFSHSLQGDLVSENSEVFSMQYGRLTPNPWWVPQWVVSEFFGLVHFGVDADQYAGWVSSERFGWMRFVAAGDGNRYLWVHRLQTWMAVNPDGSFHSFDFGWLVPEPGSLTRYNSRIGILIDDEHNPEGWLRSDRFGFVWFARDGTGVWFWSANRNEWIGITPDGGLWSTAEARFI
jgi:cyclophilin family peptidyl-prolyl cis-trans isomerase